VLVVQTRVSGGQPGAEGALEARLMGPISECYGHARNDLDAVARSLRYHQFAARCHLVIAKVAALYASNWRRNT
jgi:hypothetical protein